MAKKAKMTLKDLSEHEAFVPEADPLEDILLGAVVGSEIPFEDERLESFAATAEQFAAYRRQFDLLKTRRLVPTDRGDRGYAHNRLMELDSEYKARFEALKAASDRLHGEQKDGKSRPPHQNSSITVEEQMIWAEFKEARIDRFIQEFNKLVKEALSTIPEDILELYEESEALWNNKKGA